MTDARLRKLERAWVQSGRDDDADAYLAALQRAGAPDRAIHRVQGRWGTKASYTAKEVLAPLDEEAATYTFPVLDNGYVRLADTRLRAFRDPTRWAIVIEVLGFEVRSGEGAGSIQVAIYSFGNCVGTPAAPLGWVHPVDDDPSGPLVDEEVSSDQVLRGAKRILLRGAPVAIPRRKAHYAARGIELEEPPNILVFELLRALLPEHREALLATDAEAREHVPPDLPPFLTLDAWRHPCVGSQERPSKNLTFKRLAAALVAGDPDAYVAPDDPNTHWRHWPLGGTL